MIATLATLLLTLAADPPPAVRVGEHFKVVCHFDAGPLAAQALEAAEAVWPFAVVLYGAAPEPLDPPLVLNLYRDPDDYVAAEARITGGYFRRNLAFAHHESRTAHVALQPRLSDELLERVGLPEQTLRLVAHEAAHLARFQTWKNYAFHPSWYVDGGASWIDQQAMEELGRSLPLFAEPWTSHEFESLRNLLREGRLPSVKQVFRDDLGRVSFYDRYALRHLFFRFLRTSDEARNFDHIQRKIQETQGGRRYLTLIDRLVDELYGDAGYRRLEADFHAWLEASRPEWEQVYRSLAVRGDDWLQIAFGDHAAQAWRTDEAGDESYVLSGTLEHLPADHRELHLLFARGERGYLRVAWEAAGAVRLEYLNRQSPNSALLARAEPAGSSAGEAPIGFSVAVEEGRIRVRRGGELLIEYTDIPNGADLSGSWGVGAAPGSAGIWRGLSLER